MLDAESTPVNRELRVNPVIPYDSPRSNYLRSQGWISPKEYNDLPPSPALPYHHRQYRHRRLPTRPVSNMPAVRIRDSVAPTYLSNFRILQIILAVIYLVLICYTGVHHGYWNSLVQPLGFGISTSLATILISIPSILKQDITTRTAVRGLLIHFLRIVSEFVMIALWVASFITMLLPKGKDFRVLFDTPPHIVWGVAIAIAIIEALSFVWSLVLVCQERYAIDAIEETLPLA